MPDRYPRDGKGRFAAGNPGGGRPKGSRNKLGQDFIAELERAFSSSGRNAIKQVADENPTMFLRLIAGLVPKEMSMIVNKFEEMSDDDLQRHIEDIERSIEELANPQDRQGGSA